MRIAELDIDIGDRCLPLAEELAGVVAEVVVVGGVDDGRGKRAAQREVVVDE